MCGVTACTRGSTEFLEYRSLSKLNFAQKAKAVKSKHQIQETPAANPALATAVLMLTALQAFLKLRAWIGAQICVLSQGSGEPVIQKIPSEQRT